MIVFIGIVVIIVLYVIYLRRKAAMSEQAEQIDRKENPEKWKKIDEERIVNNQLRDIETQIKNIDRDLVKRKNEVESLKIRINWESGNLRKYIDRSSERVPPSQWMRMNKHDKADVLFRRERAQEDLLTSQAKLGKYRKQYLTAEEKVIEMEASAPDAIAKLRSLEAAILKQKKL